MLHITQHNNFLSIPNHVREGFSLLDSLNATNARLRRQKLHSCYFYHIMYLSVKENTHLIPFKNVICPKVSTIVIFYRRTVPTPPRIQFWMSLPA